MAKVLKLISEDGLLTAADLLAGNLQLEEGRRRTRIASDDLTVDAVETMPLVAPAGTSDANIITATNVIDMLAEAAGQWKDDRLRRYAVWMEENAASETARRALVKKIVLAPRDERNMSRLLGRNSASYDLVVSRRQIWENKTGDTYTSSGLSAWGGEWTIQPGATDVGNRAGRIHTLSLTPHSGSGALGQYWFGIRETRESSKTTYFQPVWELEDGQSLSADTALGSESGASPSGSSSNNKFVCTFATTASMAERVTITVGEALGVGVTDYDHMVGRYLVLVRAKVDASTTAYVKLEDGYKFAFHQHKPVKITGTSYLLYPIGEITMPALAYRAENAGASMVMNAALRIMAQRTAGSGSLHLDAIGLVPADHMVYSSIEYLTSGQYLYIYTHADDTMTYLKRIVGGYPESSGDKSSTEWGLPVNGGIGVLFAQIAGTSHLLSDSVDASMSVYPRWRLHAL